MHRPEQCVVRDETSQEVKQSQFFVHHSPRHLREPVVDPTKDAEYGSTYEYVMEVCNNEVCLMKMRVHRHRWEEHPRDSTESECNKESECPKCMSSVDKRTSVHCLEPIEYLDSSWHSNKHRCEHGHETECRRHSGSKHMVAVNDESNNSNACHCIDH